MTEKKMRAHLKRIYWHYRQLSDALTEAHNDDLLVYKDYDTESPCKSLWESRMRFEKTTQVQVARIVGEAVRAGK